MSHMFRFFGQEISPCKWAIDPEELEHIRKVLKLKVGDTLEVMDGKGLIARGHLVEISRDQALVETTPTSQYFTDKSELRRAIALGALKPGDIDDILPQLVELGMDEIHIFQQTDTAKYRTGDKPKDRWQRLIRSAMKQCKTAWCPIFVVHDSLAVAVNELQSFQQKYVLDAEASENFINTITSGVSFHSVAVIVGSERGLTTEEINICHRQGFKPMKMGKNVLRARTAAVAVAGILGALDTNP